jgi:uncharacterized protein with PIN domain
MRFIVDGMLGKLNRWLRIIGYETVYVKDGTDAELLRLAGSGSSVLLTCDEQLYRTAICRGVDSYFVRGKNEAEKLAALAVRFGIKLNATPTSSRCPACGSTIRKVSRQRVEQAVPSATFKVHQSFWQCTNGGCAKLYWRGSHWKRIEQTLEDARNELDIKRTPA